MKNYKRTVLFGVWIAMLFLPTLLLSQQRVAVYDGFRVWGDGLTATVEFLEFMDIEVDRISAATINDGEWEDDYDAIWFPGGWAWMYTRNIHNSGLNAIRQFVDDGGNYIGVCAGAFFAADIIVWEDDTLDYPLNLFDGMAIGPLDDIAQWPNYAMTDLNLNSEHPSGADIDDAGRQLYYGGPHFQLGDNPIDVLAKFSGTDMTSALTCDYGQGKLLLISTHPEIEEDDDRDGVDFAGELDDEGSDWDWLAGVVGWLLSDEEDDEEHVNDEYYLPSLIDISVYPNPFNAGVTVKVLGMQNVAYSVYDISGRIVLSERVVTGQPVGWSEFSLRTDPLPSGSLFMKLTDGEKVRFVRLDHIK